MTVSDDAPQEPGRLRQDPGLVQEWLRQNNLIYGALIAIGVFMVQPFLTAPSLDLTARICVVAFAVAIPLLAALVMVNRQEAFRRRASEPWEQRLRLRRQLHLRSRLRSRQQQQQRRRR